MLIAWQALNKLANAQDARFGDAFLIVTPGITVRDRLRVLLPNDPADYYRALDIVPHDLQPELQKAKIVITNFHAFLLREKTEASTSGCIRFFAPTSRRHSGDVMWITVPPIQPYTLAVKPSTSPICVKRMAPWHDDESLFIVP